MLDVEQTKYVNWMQTQIRPVIAENLTFGIHYHQYVKSLQFQTALKMKIATK